MQQGLSEKYDLQSIIKSFPNLFKKQNREISFNLLRKYISPTEKMENYFNKERALYFDILLELVGEKGLEDKEIQTILNSYHDFYVQECLEKTEGQFVDLESVYKKIETIFKPFKNIAKAILGKEMEIIANSFENTLALDESNKLTVKETGLISRLEKESIHDIKSSNQNIFYPLRQPILKYYLIAHFTLPEEQGDKYEYDDERILPMTQGKCKLFEMLLESAGEEEERWIAIKLTQINKYFIKETITLEEYCMDCPSLKEALIKSKTEMEKTSSKIN